MLPMLVHNGKGTEMALQIAPVNPFGRDLTCSADSDRLGSGVSAQVCAVLWFEAMRFIKAGTDLGPVLKVLWLDCNQRQEEVRGTLYTSQLWHGSPAKRFV